MASERVKSCASAHLAISIINSLEIRSPNMGSVPVAGRPSFLRLADIDFVIIPYSVKASRGEAVTSAPALTPNMR
jgi:hypothetical protein